MRHSVPGLVGARHPDHAPRHFPPFRPRAIWCAFPSPLTNTDAGARSGDRSATRGLEQVHCTQTAGRSTDEPNLEAVSAMSKLSHGDPNVSGAGCRLHRLDMLAQSCRRLFCFPYAGRRSGDFPPVAGSSGQPMSKCASPACRAATRASMSRLLRVDGAAGRSRLAREMLRVDERALRSVRSQHGALSSHSTSPIKLSRLGRPPAHLFSLFRQQRGPRDCPIAAQPIFALPDKEFLWPGSWRATL